MLILLPPSEGKSAPTQRAGFNPLAHSFPSLAPPITAVAEALARLSRQPKRAAAALGLGPTQLGELQANVQLWQGPLSPAIELFNGVLFDALDYPSLSAAQRKRADGQLLIFNALTGVARPQDLLPGFRLSGTATLPKVGNLGNFWRKHLQEHLEDLGDGLVVDARSGTYTRFWTPPTTTPLVELKVMQFVGVGSQRRKVAVSHFNKATKGQVVRELVKTGKRLRGAAAVADHLTAAGWEVDLLPKAGTDGAVLEVLIRQ